jgi:hypothetical protein
MKPAPAKTDTITIHVPMRFQLRGGRKMVISDAVAPPPPRRTDNAILKALARAHRWRRQIENGEYASITELAKANRVNQSYACRLLRLTLLAPSIVTDILNGRQSPDLTLKKLARPLSVRWDEQLHILPVSASTHAVETTASSYSPPGLSN